MVAVGADRQRCEPCEANEYQASAGQTVCSTCASGTFSTVGSATCSAVCPIGTEKTNNGCAACTAGKYGPSDASTGGQCVNCPSGSSSDQRSTFCVPCPNGSHTGGQIAGTCVYCSVGYYWSGSGCRASPSGTIALPAAGARQPIGVVQCPSGKISTSAASECTACRDKFISRVGNSVCSRCECADCAEYGLQVLTVNNTCVCPAGFRLHADEVTCVGCNAGTFRAPGMPQHACLPCAIGEYGGGMAVARCERCLHGDTTLFLGSLTDSACTPSYCQPCGSPDEVPVCTDRLGSQCQVYDQALPGGTLWPNGWYLSPHLRPIANMSDYFSGGVIRIAFNDIVQKLAILYQENGKRVIGIFSTSTADARVGPFGKLVDPWYAESGEYVDIIWAADSNSMYCVRNNGGVDLYQRTPNKRFLNAGVNHIQRNWISPISANGRNNAMGHGLAVTPSDGFPACNLVSSNVLVCAVVFANVFYDIDKTTKFTKISILDDVATMTPVTNHYLGDLAKKNTMVVLGSTLYYVTEQTGRLFSVPIDQDFNILVNQGTFMSPPSGSLLGGMQVRLRAPKRVRPSSGVVYGIRSDNVWFTSIARGLTSTIDAIGIPFSLVDDFTMLSSGHMMVVHGEMISVYEHIASCPLERTTLLPSSKLATDCICLAGEYNDGRGNCIPCTPCRSGEYETGQCTGNSNTVCRVCSRCAIGNWTQQQCAGTNDTVCSTCLDQHCPVGTWAAGGCTGTELSGNLQCVPCGQCRVDEYVVSYNLCSNVSKPTCAPCGGGCLEVSPKFLGPG